MALKATKLADNAEELDPTVPGQFQLRCFYQNKTEIAGIAFICPCGCGMEGWLPVRRAGSPRTQRPEWEWDGNEEAPTVHPSVFNTGFPCKWHGWLKNGEWRSV